MLTRFESQLLKKLGCPPWEDSIPNKITVWRARAGIGGSISCYIIYRLSDYFFPAPYLYFFLIVMNTVFSGSVITDIVDGKWARSLDGTGKTAETAFGRFVDPTADKLTAAAGYLIIFAHYGLRAWLIAILGIVLYDRGVMRIRGTDENMRTLKLAKIKQVLLNIGIMALLVGVLAQDEIRWGKHGWQDVLEWVVSIGNDLLWCSFYLCAVLAVLYKYPRIGKKVDAVFGWVPFGQYIW